MTYKELLELSRKYPNCTSLEQVSIFTREYRDKASVERHNRLLMKAYQKINEKPK